MEINTTLFPSIPFLHNIVIIDIKNKIQKAAFTLVEVVVVVAILGISIPVIFSVLTTVAKQQGKIYRLSEAKQQGDYALAFIRNHLRNDAGQVYGILNAGTLESELCATDGIATTQSGEDFYYEQSDQANQYFRFYNGRATIALDDGQREISQLFYDNNGVIEPLTTNKVKIENFEMKCIRKNLASRPFILVSFIIYFTGDSDSFDINVAPPEDIAILNYQTVVQLR